VPKQRSKSNDPTFTEATTVVAKMKEASEVFLVALSVLGARIHDLELSVEQRKAENAKILEAHINDPDLRPKIVHTTTKSIHTIAINDQIYRFGPRPDEDLALIHDDDDNYFWTDPTTLTHYCKSNFHALLAVLNHFATRGQT
jgi:hypothetical protein